MSYHGEQASKQEMQGSTYQKFAYPVAPPSQPQPQHLEHINTRLQDLGQDLMNRVARLEVVADKTFGSSDKAGGPGSAMPIANGDIERIDQSVSSLFDLLHRLGVAVTRLERL